jgi:hypothetical protein
LYIVVINSKSSKLVPNKMSADQGFETKARRKAFDSKGTALNLLEFNQPHPKVKATDGHGITSIIPAAQNLTLHQTTFDQDFAPSTAVNSNLLSVGGSVLIPVSEGSGGGTVNQVFIRFEVANSTGASCTLVPVPLLFESIELLANGSNIIHRIPGDHLFTDLAYLTTENLTAFAHSLNTTATLGAPTAIANGDTIVYFLPVMNCPLAQAHVYLPAIKGGVTFRLNFRPSSQTLEAGAAPTLNNLTVCIVGDALPYDHHEEMVQQYQNNVLDFRITNCLTNSVPYTINASANTPFKLTGISGMIAGGFVNFRSTVTGSGLRTFSSIANGTLDIVDGSDKTMIGSPKRGTFINVWDWQRLFGNTIGSSVALYPIGHAQSLLPVMNQGVMTGYNFYDNNCSIKLITDSTWTNGTYYVDYFAKQYAVLRICKGKIDQVYSSG